MSPRLDEDRHSDATGPDPATQHAQETDPSRQLGERPTKPREESSFGSDRALSAPGPYFEEHDTARMPAPPFADKP